MCNVRLRQAPESKPAPHAAAEVRASNQPHAFLLHEAAYRLVADDEQVVRDELYVFVSVLTVSDQQSLYAGAA